MRKRVFFNQGYLILRTCAGYRRTGVMCDAMMIRQLFQTQSLSGMLEKVGVALIDLDFFVLLP